MADADEPWIKEWINSVADDSIKLPARPLDR